MSLTAEDCVPIAAASVASRANCAHPAGLAPLTSHPTVNPASSVSSASSTHITWAGSTRPSLVCAGAARSLAACAIHVPPATPTMYPPIDTAVWLARLSDPRAAARPHSTMLPVMTLVKTPPSWVKLATSAAPDPKVSAIAITVRSCCRGLLFIPRYVSPERSGSVDADGPGPGRRVRCPRPEQPDHHPGALRRRRRPRRVAVGQDDRDGGPGPQRDRRRDAGAHVGPAPADQLDLAGRADPPGRAGRVV